MNFHLHGEKISRCSWATVCQTSRVIFFNVLRSLPRFSKEVATFRSYFYLFPFFFLQNLIFPRKLVVIQFHIPFLLPFPPLLNYDSKHRLPLFRVPAFHRCPPLFRIFFVHFNYESPLFLASLNEFHSDWILSFPFSFPSPRALPSRSPISYPRPARPPSFLSISRPGVIDTSDSSVRRDGRRSPTEPATKTNEGSVCIVYSRGSSMEARVFRAAILEWNFYNGHFSPFPPYDLFLLFVREREISNFPPLLLPSNYRNRYQFSCKFSAPLKRSFHFRPQLSARLLSSPLSRFFILHTNTPPPGPQQPRPCWICNFYANIPVYVDTWIFFSPMERDIRLIFFFLFLSLSVIL